jgi:hypothetical protein
LSTADNSADGTFQLASVLKEAGSVEIVEVTYNENVIHWPDWLEKRMYANKTIANFS